MSELPNVYGNKSQLQEVISNLIVNAIEAMDATTDQSRVLHVDTRRFPPPRTIEEREAKRDSGFAAYS
jgi:nitrogen-specific signal transduction histidine kinase